MNSHYSKIKFKDHPNLKQYSLEDILGHGSYGKVKLASHKLTNEKVAIKCVEKSKLLSLNDTRRIQTEMKIIAQLNHPNIIREIEMFEDQRFFYIVMERPSKGDLFKYVCSKKRLSLREASFMFYQIVNAVDYIHRKGIVHRDLKPENILLSEDMIIKLGDFGLSAEYQCDGSGCRLKTRCGSPAYSAPEMLQGRKYDPIPVDVWGLGVILYVMICGQLPFEEENEAQLFVKITHCNIQFPHFCNASCKALIKKILLPNPQERLSIEDIKKSNIYITGRANFLKELKIYNDDGSVLPQVYSYIKEKALEALDLCIMENGKDTETTPGFLIFYYKLLHKTDWQNYNIPIHSSQNRAIISFNKQDKDKGTCYNKVSKSKKSLIKDLLLIKNHSTISDTLSAKTGSLNLIEQKNNSHIRLPKLHLLTHSFDAQIQNKQITPLFIPSNAHKTERVHSLRSSSMSTIKHKNNITIDGNRNKARSHMHKTNNEHKNNKATTYSIEDYENDLRYLYKRGYKQNSLMKIRPAFKI